MSRLTPWTLIFSMVCAPLSAVVGDGTEAAFLGAMAIIGNPGASKERPPRPFGSTERATSVWPERAFSVSRSAAAAETPVAALAHYGVENVDGGTTFINGLAFGPALAATYYQMSGDPDSGQRVIDGIRLRSKGNWRLLQSILACALAGGSAGIVAGQNNAYTDTHGMGTAAGGAAGLIGGALIGLAPGFYFRHANVSEGNSKIEDAGKSFNRYLKGQLHLGFAPSVRGVQWCLKIGF